MCTSCIVKFRSYFFGGVNHCGFSESLNDIQITIEHLIDHIRRNAIIHSGTYACFLY